MALMSDQTFFCNKCEHTYKANMFYGTNNLEKYEMPDDDILILMSSSHPLARDVRVHIKSLENYPVILGDSPEVEAIFRDEYNTRLSVLMYSSELAPSIDIIRHYNACTFITKSVLANYALPKDVIALPLVEKCKAGNFFICKKDHPLSELEKEILKHSSRILSNF